MEIIEKYFTDLNNQQKEQFAKLDHLYREWNQKINVISRKDIDLLYERHIIHSLAIAKIIQFKKNTSVLDVGTGGGFPGIPLAILFPSARFHLIDSIGKKIKVVNSVIHELGLKNTKAEQKHSNELKGRFDFVVSRAVTAFPKFVDLMQKKIKYKNFNSLQNGILYLKGGDLEEELKDYRKKILITPINVFFEEEFFETKSVVYYPMH
ncbi:MAG: 16S rRNA (guanine(527)-N(7))-methyltransferase RsmG [Bacteroidota bacterium]